ncbi:helix-turn-helix domain-containing protein, partial [Micromonospora chalcea]
MTDGTGNRRVSDPRAMRALAHPTRLRLLGELRLRGPQTVGMLSERTGEAVGSVSYHVGKLAEHGFVTEAPDLARDRRERWWGGGPAPPPRGAGGRGGAPAGRRGGHPEAAAALA